MEQRKKETNQHLKQNNHRMYKRTLGTLIVSVILISTISCNGQAMVKMNKEDAGGIITTNIAFASFFVDYLRDLIGFKVFSDAIDLKQLQTFLLSKKGTKNVSASINNDTETITIIIETSDINTLLKELDIPITTNQNQTRIQITQDTIQSFLMHLPAFAEIGTSGLFLFQDHPVEKKKFPQYIAWALSDYAEDNPNIEKTIEKSFFKIMLEKQKKNVILPDLGWQKINNNTQLLNLNIIDILYEKSYNVWYSY